MAAITEKIGGFMLANGVGKYEFAEKVGLDYRQLVKRLDGDVDWRLSELRSVAKVVGCSVDELVREEE